VQAVDSFIGDVRIRRHDEAPAAAFVYPSEATAFVEQRGWREALPVGTGRSTRSESHQHTPTSRCSSSHRRGPRALARAVQGLGDIGCLGGEGGRERFQGGGGSALQVLLGQRRGLCEPQRIARLQQQNTATSLEWSHKESEHDGFGGTGSGHLYE
jgi:hypothetical protein